MGSAGIGSRLRGALLAPLLLVALQGHGMTVEELQSSGRLEIKAGVQPETEIVVGQKVVLFIELATDRWFSGGTRVSVPEVPGLVILQTEKFATNASELRAGQNWVIQRWSLDVFPQREGDFSVGPIAVTVSVSHEDAGVVSGDLESPPVSFTVTRPSALEQVKQWVSAPEYRVTQSFDRTPGDLQVGDAIEREIVFEASDVMAMMLPGVQPEQMPGLAAYPSPPILENNNNRGTATARRVERTSYLAEAPGSYQLPAREYVWWNTSTQRMALLTLPATEIVVAGSAEPASGSAKPNRNLNWRHLLSFAGALLLALLLLNWARYLPWPARERLLAPFLRLRSFWRDLRRPALAAQLNPDSSAGE